MKSKLVFLLIVAAALASMSGISLLVRLAYSLALVFVLGYLWVRLNVRSLEAEIYRNTARLQVGQWLNEEIIIRNTGMLPKLLVEVQGNADLPGYRNVNVVSLLPGKSRSWTARTKCLLRGCYNMAPLSVTSEDLFGLFSRKRLLGKPQTLLVYPMVLELPDLLSFLGEGYRRGQSDSWGEQIPPNVSAIRDYLPGDSLRFIHWPSTARNARLIVKDFKEDCSEKVWIVLDLCSEVQAGIGMESTEEYGVTIAASIAKKCLDANRPLGLIAWGDQRYHLSPQKGRHNLGRVLEMMALVKARGSTPLTEVVSAEAERFGINSTVILITPSADALSGAAVLRLRRRGIRVIAILLDAASFAGLPVPQQNSAVPATNGMETYLVRQGEDIATALSARTESRVRVVMRERGKG